MKGDTNQNAMNNQKMVSDQNDHNFIKHSIVWALTGFGKVIIFKMITQKEIIEQRMSKVYTSNRNPL